MISQIGEEVDLSLLPRPESIIRSGKVVWVGDGPRDKIVPDEFKPKVQAPAKKTAAKKTVAKKATPPAKKAAAS